MSLSDASLNKKAEAMRAKLKVARELLEDLLCEREEMESSHESHSNDLIDSIRVDKAENVLLREELRDLRMQLDTPSPGAAASPPPRELIEASDRVAKLELQLELACDNRAADEATLRSMLHGDSNHEEPSIHASMTVSPALAAAAASPRDSAGDSSPRDSYSREPSPRDNYSRSRASSIERELHERHPRAAAGAKAAAEGRGRSMEYAMTLAYERKLKNGPATSPTSSNSTTGVARRKAAARSARISDSDSDDPYADIM